jgi:hypothetical protein
MPLSARRPSRRIGRFGGCICIDAKKGAVQFRAMKGLPNWVVNGLVLLLLLFCLFTIVMWARSGVYPLWWGWDDVLSVQYAGRGVYIASSRGELSLNYVDVSVYDPSAHMIEYNFNWQNPSTGLRKYRDARPKMNVEFAGFYFAGSTHVLRFANGKLGPVNQWDFGVPYWFLLIVSGLWPVRRFLAFRRRRKRMVAGQFCEGCGYDLRATPERCPECGKVVVKIARTGPQN